MVLNERRQGLQKQHSLERQCLFFSLHAPLRQNIMIDISPIFHALLYNWEFYLLVRHATESLHAHTGILADCIDAGLLFSN